MTPAQQVEPIWDESLSCQSPSTSIFSAMPSSPSARTTMASASSPSSATAATQFTLFRLLPTELQLKIFKHIDAQHIDDVHVKVCPSLDENSITFKALSSVPVILHLCQDSREEGLKKYKAVFEERKGGSRRIYVDFQQDTLYIQLPDLKTRRLFRRIAERMKAGQVPLLWFTEQYPDFEMYADDTPQAPLDLSVGMIYNFNHRECWPKPNELTYGLTAVVKKLDTSSDNDQWEQHLTRISGIDRSHPQSYFCKPFSELRNWDVVWEELREDLLGRGWYRRRKEGRLQLGLTAAQPIRRHCRGFPTMDWGFASARWCFN